MMCKGLFCLLLFIGQCTLLNAQLCQGSLGDPIVNITFGSGSNPGPASAAVSGMQYVAADCPNDGSYTIRNSTSGCFGSTWFVLGKDHTGDANGYFMLINASVQPSVFYLDTVRGLCGNTTYEFAAWVMNILKLGSCNNSATMPNLTFQIERTDGTLLQSYNTGNMQPSNTPDWKQYGFFFTTPSNVSDVVLRITNNSQGGCGNDLAMDDITFRPCGPKLTPSINNTASTNLDFCEGGPAQQTSFNCTVSSGFNNPSYQWQSSTDNGITWTDIPNETALNLTMNFSPATVGKYLYRITAAEAGNMGIVQCRISSTALSIQVNARPTTTASSNSPVCEQQTVTLSATGGSQYAWTGPNSFVASTDNTIISNAQLSNDGKYYVQVTNSVGCSKLDSTMVQVKQKPMAAVQPVTANICLGDSITLYANGGGNYLWVPATGLSSSTTNSVKASPTDTTTYQIEVTAQNGCKDTAQMQLNIRQLPIVNAGNDILMVQGQYMPLNGSVIGNYDNHYWTPNWYIADASALSTVINPSRDTFYVLNAETTDCGTVRDTLFVKVYPSILVPNVFSPNGDGINDTWEIPALSAYANMQLSIFDRYGAAVFTSTNYTSGWNGSSNGKPLPPGIYYYIISLKQQNRTISGWVQLIR